MLGNTYELSARGFLSAAVAESRKLDGYMRMAQTANEKGSISLMRLAIRCANESADRIETLLSLAREWSEMDAAYREN